jgi:large subunit ribosomal protein L25
MAERPRLEAATRTITGKGVARLRRQGLLPAVVYGHGVPSEPVTVDAHAFDLLHRHVGTSTLVNLSVDGKRARAVLVQGVQINVVTRRPQHVDLFAVRMTEELSAEVPLVGDGHAPAVDLGGTLAFPMTALRVRALPTDLPGAVHFDLSALTTLDSWLTVGDLVLPEGVTAQSDATEVVARVITPRVAEVADDAAAAADAPAADAPAAEA